jgi:polyisoprenoid-binding protein YceI
LGSYSLQFGQTPSVELATGTYDIGPPTGALMLHTGRSGFGAMAGHDLVIEVMRWGGTVRIDAERIEASLVEVVVDATSLEVREGKGGAVPLLAINKSEIGKTINKVLSAEKHPEMRFRSTAVTRTVDGFIVHGDLTITGTTRSAELTVLIDITGQPRGTVTTTVLQSDFGIKPYSAMLGALRVRDAVEVHAEVQLP